MIRTIHIVFVQNKIINTSHLKEYRFLCSFDCVKVGDIIKDLRYTPYMQVVRITNCEEEIQEGFVLKKINISTINNKKIEEFQNNQNKSNMEARNISITINQAIEWYNSGNATLKALALNAYTKKELELNYEAIASKVDLCREAYNFPLGECRKFRVLIKLATIAKHYNKSWKKTACNTGYFIGKYSINSGPIVDTLRGVGIYQHNTVQYAGIVYFKNSEDAVKAVEILGEELKELF